MVKLVKPRKWTSEPPKESTNRDRVNNYLMDESRLVVGRAYKVVYPMDEEQISSILRRASERGERVTVSGAGTGLTGGRVPLGDIVLSTEYMRGVSRESRGKEIRVDLGGARYVFKHYVGEDGLHHVTAPIGVTIETLIYLLDSLGLVYPPNPTEKSAFLGGNLSTHASGKWSFRFGPLRKYIYRLRLVLPSGGVLELVRGEYRVKQYIELETVEGKSVELRLPIYSTPRVRKSSAWPNIEIGDDLIDFFIGMDGILGVYSEVELTPPNKPQNIYSIFSIVGDEDNLLQAVYELRRNKDRYGIWAVEFMDHRCLEFIKERIGRSFPNIESGGVLYIDVAGGDDIFDNLSGVNDILEAAGSIDTYASDDPRWLEEAMRIRHLVPESVNNYIARHGTHRVASDASVPDNRLGEVLSLYRELGDEAGIEYLIYGHIGDSHLHFNFLPRNSDEIDLAMRYLTMMLGEIVSWGGSVTAEHGFGKKKFLDEDGEYKPLIMLQYGDKAVEDVRDLKSSVDPQYILNVGNIIEPE